MSEIIEKKEYYENGVVEVYSFYKDNKLHGEYKEYYEDGNLKEHTFYKDDKLHGEYKSYYEDGALKFHFFYEDGHVLSKEKYVEKISTKDILKLV